jgi:hypothetical protein
MAVRAVTMKSGCIWACGLAAAACAVAPVRAQSAADRHPPAAPAGPTPTPTSAGSLTLQQLRADPVGARGKTVRWTVQIYALETADVLRKGLEPNELYLLVTGPGQENATLYVAVPDTLEQTARTLASVAPVTVRLTATVRVGRSDPLGVPILDAVRLDRP